MKKHLIGVLLVLVSFGACAKDDFVLSDVDQDTCRMFGDYATFVMTMRQGGVDIDFHLKRLDQAKTTAEPLRLYFKDMVRTAYKYPIAPNSNEKKSIITAFSKDIQTGCIEGFTSAIKEANEADN